MRGSNGIPEDDRYATIGPFDEDHFNYGGNYIGINRTKDMAFKLITLNKGRTTELKKALYDKIAERLATYPGVSRGDVIGLIEVSKEDWTLGNGEAQYA